MEHKTRTPAIVFIIKVLLACITKAGNQRKPASGPYHRALKELEKSNPPGKWTRLALMEVE